MRRLILSLALALPLPMAAHAHDFWIAPETFALEAPGPVEVELLVGHGGDNQDWPARPARIVTFATASDGALTDQQTAIPPAGTNRPIIADFASEGAHYLMLASTEAFSELPADTFMDYAEDEGITPILEHRARRGASKGPGREVYSRRGKALIQVGPVDAADEAFVTRPLGLTLEVVPLRHPGLLDAGEALPFEVRWRGERLAGATVHVGNLTTGEGAAPLTTDAAGRASLPASAGAEMMLHVVWADPAEGLLEEADYSTVFSSLTFAFPDTATE